MVGARRLDAGCITDIGGRAGGARLYCAVDEVSVVPVEKFAAMWQAVRFSSLRLGDRTT